MRWVDEGAMRKYGVASVGGSSDGADAIERSRVACLIPFAGACVLALQLSGCGSSSGAARASTTPEAGTPAASSTPSGTAGSWASRGPGGGGALYVPSLSPHSADEIFMATDMSGVFHSTDWGRHWDTVPFGHLQGGTVARVRYTSDPKVLFAVNQRDDGAVLVKSKDGGASWSAPVVAPSKSSVYSLEVDPSSTQRVLASDSDALYASADGGAHFAKVFSFAGLLVGGAHFRGDDVFVGTNAGVLVSHDGGGSFSVLSMGGLPTGEAIVSFAGATAAGTTRFFAVTWDRGSAGPDVTGGDLDAFAGLYVADEGGAWAKTSGLGPSDKLSFVATSGDAPDVAFAAGGDRDSSSPTVFKTSDGGKSFRPVLLTAGNKNVATGWSGEGGSKGWSFGEYALGLAVRPRDGNRVVVTDLGFVHVSNDGGATWHQAYVDPADETPAGQPTPISKSTRTSGVDQTSVWWLTWSDAKKVFMCVTDITSALSDDGGKSWARAGDNGLSLNTTYHGVTGPDGALYVATSSVHDLYQSPYLTDDRVDRGTGAIMVSKDGGAHFSTFEDIGHPVVFLALTGNTLYASVASSAAGGIYAKDLASPSQPARRLSAPPRANGHPYNVWGLKDGSLLVSYSGRREGTSSNRGAFAATSGVFLSSDGGAHWEDRTAPAMQRWTKDVIVEPNDPAQNTWYAGVFTAAGDGAGGLYRTTDRGATWARVSAPMNVESLAVSPNDKKTAYLMTESNGLLVTHDLDAATPDFKPVEGYPFRQPLRAFWNPFDKNEVWVTSFGGGLRVHRGE